MAWQFEAAKWLERWVKVGGVQIGAAGRVSLVADLDGNAAAQQSLLTQLDAGRGRREQVRECVLERMRPPTSD
jgi:hypothetical protein